MVTGGLEFDFYDTLYVFFHSQLEALRPTMSWMSAAILSSATPSTEFSSTGLSPRLQAYQSGGNTAVSSATTEGDTTMQGGSPGAEEGGSQLGMELSTHRTRETEEGKEEVKEEEEAGIVTIQNLG